MNVTFDSAGNPKPITLILAAGNGELLGQLDAENIVYANNLKEADEISFRIHKYVNGVKCSLWDKIVDFKLVWCKDYNTWFQITVTTDESEETIKNVLGVSLGEAELSQIMLYDIEINTEDDIARENYKTTVLYKPDDKEASLLHRILEKAPHYSVSHVDSTIKNIQRTFSFNNTSIFDALQEIGEEMGCLFILNLNSDENGKIQRTVSVYDIQSYCYECGHRGIFTLNCPECHSTNINEGYGEDTTIFVTSDELGKDIQFSTDTGSVKNCFKLEAGDDLMTATIKNCNPNGSDYIWYLSNEMKADMSDDLVNKLADYDNDFEYYQSRYSMSISSASAYNTLINKYISGKPTLEKISSPIKGYTNLMNALYSTINFRLYLESELMPKPNTSLVDTNAKLQAALLTSSALSPVAIEAKDITKVSLASANSAVLLMAKVIVDSRYQIKVNNSSLAGSIWTGNFIITNYSDEEDTAVSSSINIILNNNQEQYIKQCIDRTLNKNDVFDAGIIGLFKMNDFPEQTNTPFKNEIKKYCLNSLVSFHDACQSCIDILIQQGIADGETWSDKEPNLYDDLYLPYYTKLQSLSAEIKIREDEIKIVSNMQQSLYKLQSYIQNELNFENYLGKDLWFEFCSYKREDLYSNSNYISDGLTDSEIFDKAQKFIKIAKEEIFKSAEFQHSISTNLKNLLVIKKFKPLVDKFKVGNWLRIQVDDIVYKLRLLSYEVDFDSLENLSVEFSDVMKTANGLTDQKNLMQKAASMASSYDATKRQAEQGKKSKEQLNDWVNKGLSLTNMKIVGNADNQNQTWDKHGILCREYSPVTDDYDNRQLKIINRGLYVTDDNWLTSKAGIGNFTFWNPETQKMDEAYGVIADTLVGNLILSEKVGIYNQNNSISLSENGIVVTTNGILDDDNVSHNKMLFTVQKETKDGIEKLMYLNDNGELVLNGSFKINSDNQETEFDDVVDKLVEDTGSAIDAVNNSLDKINESIDEASNELSTAIDNSYDKVYAKIFTDSEEEISLRTELLNKMKADTDAVWNSLNTIGTGIDIAVKHYLDEYKAEVGQYLNYDENGLTLGAKESAFKTVIDNQGVWFKQNNATVSYVKNNMLYIPNAVIDNSFTLGKYHFTVSDDDSFTLSWVN